MPRRLLQAELQYYATKKIGIGRSTVATTTAQAGYSTCRNDGTAVIPDFKPRLANRCSKEVKKGAIRASILDFKPKLANRCSQKVKTGAIPAAQGLEHYHAPGNAGWADSAAETPSTRHKKKSPDSSLNRDSRSAAATYSPTWCSSTIGASELNFSVRDGKRWILTAITAAI